MNKDVSPALNAPPTEHTPQRLERLKRLPAYVDGALAEDQSSSGTDPAVGDAGAPTSGEASLLIHTEEDAHDTSGSEDQQVRGAQFLVEEFGLSARTAADLVADETGDQADSVVAELVAIENSKNPLQGLPTPEAGEPFEPHSDDGGVKPVVVNRGATAS